MKKKIVYLALILMTFLGSALLGSPTSSAQNVLSVDAPSVVAVDEVFQIVFTADGKAKDFSLPTMSDITILAGPTTSTMSSTSYINGKRTHTYENSFTFVAQCSKPGKFTIPAASVKIDGKICRSQALEIEVVKQENTSQQQSGTTSAGSSATQTSPSNSLSSEDLFLVLELSDSQVVKGEAIVATLKLYTQVDIAGFEDVNFPSFNGFWSQELDSPSQIQFGRENYKGKIYNSALLKKYVLIPQQSGKVDIDPAELVCAVQIRSASRGNSLFDDFFGSYTTVRKRLSTPKKTITVNELPAGAPASFKGAVGEFSLEAKLSKNGMKAHEAASLSVVISGSGNLNLIEAPNVKFPPDFEVYDVKRNEEIRTSAKGASGKKIFEYPFIPRSHGEFKMDPVEFTYYDPVKNKYVTLKSEPISLSVAPGDEKSALVLSSGGVNKRSVKNLGEDIRFISNELNSLKKDRAAWVSTKSFYIVLALIGLIFAALVLILDRHIERNRDVVKVKNRKASKVAKARLKGAGVLLKQGQNAAFYEELHKALFCYVSDKLMLPVADLSKERVEEKLLAMGKSSETIAELFSIIEACEYARYAPSSKPGAMEEQFQAALRIISKIEE